MLIQLKFYALPSQVRNLVLKQEPLRNNFKSKTGNFIQIRNRGGISGKGEISNCVYSFNKRNVL